MNKKELLKLKENLTEALAPMYGAYGYFCMGELEKGNEWAEKSSTLFKVIMKYLDKQLGVK